MSCHILCVSFLNACISLSVAPNVRNHSINPLSCCATLAPVSLVLFGAKGISWKTGALGLPVSWHTGPLRQSVEVMIA